MNYGNGRSSPLFNIVASAQHASVGEYSLLVPQLLYFLVAGGNSFFQLPNALQGILVEQLGIIEATNGLCLWLFLRRLLRSRGLVVTKTARGQPVRQLCDDDRV
jgi:hypothetical protein